MKVFYKILFIALFFSSNFVLTQENNEEGRNEQKTKEKPEKVFRIGVHITPNLYFFGNTSTQDVRVKNRHIFNADISLVFTAKLGPIIELKTGFGYSSKNLTREEECLICGNDIVEESKIKTNFLEIPLLVNLYIYNSRLDVYGIVGLRNSFLVGAKNIHTANINGGSSSTFNVKDKFSSYLLGIQAGAGINYNLTYSLSLSGELLYTFSPFVFEPDTGMKFHGLGLNLGLNFKL